MGLRREVPGQEPGQGLEQGGVGGFLGVRLEYLEGGAHTSTGYGSGGVAREEPKGKTPSPRGSFSPNLPYTEDSEDASGSQQLQAPLVVGGAVLLVCVHHSHIEGACFARGEKLVLRGREGQMWLSPQA